MSDSANNTTRLPLFPLNTVVFPNGLLALRLFETRYVDMARRCLREDSGFVVVATAVPEATLATLSRDNDASTGDTGSARSSTASMTLSLDSTVAVPHDPAFGFAGFGTRVRILEADLRSDGLLGIECEGLERVKIDSVTRQRDGLWLGDVCDQPADADHISTIDGLVDLARNLAERLTASGDTALMRRGERLREAAAGHTLHDLVGRLAELLPLDLADRQALLELDDAITRGVRLTSLLLPDDANADDPGADEPGADDPGADNLGRNRHPRAGD